MNLYDQCLTDLRARFGQDAFLLSPEQIAPIVKSSVEVQANQRSHDKKNERAGINKPRLFPLPVKQVGRLVYVSIYHLAEWMATGDCQETEVPDSSETSPEQEHEPPIEATAPVAKKPKNESAQRVSKQGKYDALLLSWQNNILFQRQLFDEIERLGLAKTGKDGIERDPNEGRL